MTPAEEKFSVYVLTDLYFSPLGEIVLITTVSPGQKNDIYAEGIALIEQSKTRSMITKLHAKEQSIPEVGLSIDANFMVDAALDAAKAFVSEAMLEKFNKTKNWNIFSSPPAFIETPSAFLARSWIRNRWKTELDALKNQSKCHTLIEYLSFVTTLPSASQPLSTP